MKNNNLNLGEYETEHEAAYAYNVAEVAMTPMKGRKPTMAELNTHLELTAEQAAHVEDTVWPIMRKEMGLPDSFKLPDVMKQFLKQTYVQPSPA